jgi:tRNA-uridine 2-sulfurtransferase
MTRLRVLAAMSGGVDSAVAAARAAGAGHEVTGVHLALSRNPSSYRTGARGCCTLEDARDARRAADVIGIPFYVWDLAERFHRDVVQDFVDEYARGHTPNPCLRCNEKIKFAAVLDRAVALGFDAVCTGHHARLVPADGGGQRLRRSVDMAKDQSYVLAVLTGDQLARAMFPLGDTTKDQVRREAAERGLAVADKPDSHDVCFISDGDTRKFLRGQLGTTPGRIVDQDGQVVGRHDGSYGFTVGQRKGLRIGTPAPDGRPRYVLDIEPVSNTVTVGPAEALGADEIEAERPVWSGCRPPGDAVNCLVQLRAHGQVHPARARQDGDILRISLDEPARGVARGQAAVLYDGDVVLGSGTITSATATGAATTGVTTAASRRAAVTP